MHSLYQVLLYFHLSSAIDIFGESKPIYTVSHSYTAEYSQAQVCFIGKS